MLDLVARAEVEKKKYMEIFACNRYVMLLC